MRGGPLKKIGTDLYDRVDAHVALMAAVMETTKRDLRSRKAEKRHDALVFVRTELFERYCDALGVDPKRARRGLLSH